jgi:predicted DNA-binding transcriptional regulator AlpA
MATTDSPQLERWLRKSEVLELTTLRKTALEKMVREGRFPPPVPLNEAHNRVAWPASEVIAWQQKQLAVRRRRIAESEAELQRALDVNLDIPRRLNQSRKTR